MISFQKFRIYINKCFIALICLFSFVVLLPFLMLIARLVKSGLKYICLDFFTQTSPSPVDAMLANLAGEAIPGGILNGICGSLYMLTIALVLTVPLGILTGIYLYENRGKKFANLIQYLNAVCYGMPSIIIGIVVYVSVVKSFHSYSVLAGGIALSISMLPKIIRTTRETLKLLPAYLKESGLALGGSYTGVILKIIMPAAKGGLLTGILISVSRALGETVPLIVTALGCSMINWNINAPASSMTLLIWDFFNTPNMVSMVWATSAFLFSIIICLNLIAKRIGRQWKFILYHE
ncbi:MAG: phosphate ABC transporter permease PstA [Dysgonamonadaceae bacterium]|jgi:phosphate transport system permease protein|nr:phosphate ABC transporter permease PstA [Dysgonamonadaceae bacterium]